MNNSPENPPPPTKKLSQNHNPLTSTDSTPDFKIESELEDENDAENELLPSSSDNSVNSSTVSVAEQNLDFQTRRISFQGMVLSRGSRIRWRMDKTQLIRYSQRAKLKFGHNEVFYPSMVPHKPILKQTKSCPDF